MNMKFSITLLRDIGESLEAELAQANRFENISDAIKNRRAGRQELFSTNYHERMKDW